MSKEKLIKWLSEGDVSIQFQVSRDLLRQDRPDLQERIANEGWGAGYLKKRNPNGHWGRGFYQAKWISTHYSLLDLRHLEFPPGHPLPRETIDIVLSENVGEDGGVNPSRSIANADVCINGMFLNYACHFMTEPKKLHSIVDFIIANQMHDGGFNCRSNRSGAIHSSLHSTISILEGILEYARQGYTYRLHDLQSIAQESREFILEHRLFRSDKTGEIINKHFLMLSYPSRWKYDVLRALDYFQAAGIEYDPRMQDAIDVLLKKRRKDGTWPVQAKHAGLTHFDMEKTGGPSRWNTLRALRALQKYGANGAQ